MTQVFAANWKMNHGPSAAREFVADFLSEYQKKNDRIVIIAPPAVAIETVARGLAGRDDLRVGVQNISTRPKGAFTGETSAAMAADAGARVAIVGHSERRHVFGETNAETADKCAMAVQAGLVPMLCVGETLAQRQSGETFDVVTTQLREGLAPLTTNQVSGAMIAYEPVWAIGTGKTATPDDAAQVHREIHRTLTELLGTAAVPPILYGGSVTADNAASLLAAPLVSGVLVGGASLDPGNWARICAAG